MMSECLSQLRARLEGKRLVKCNVGSGREGGLAQSTQIQTVNLSLTFYNIMNANLTFNSIIYISGMLYKFKGSFVVNLPNVNFVGKKYVLRQCACSFCGFHSTWQASEYPWESLHPI